MNRHSLFAENSLGCWCPVTFQHVSLNEDRMGDSGHKVLSRGRNTWSEFPEHEELLDRAGAGNGVLGRRNSMCKGTEA